MHANHESSGRSGIQDKNSTEAKDEEQHTENGTQEAKVSGTFIRDDMRDDVIRSSDQVDASSSSWTSFRPK